VILLTGSTLLNAPIHRSTYDVENMLFICEPVQIQAEEKEKSVVLDSFFSQQNVEKLSYEGMNRECHLCNKHIK